MHQLSFLQCPITKSPLVRMNQDQVQALNLAIERGEVRHFDGTPVSLELTDGYTSLSGEFAYAVKGDIVMLLPALAIALGQKESELFSVADLTKTQRLVKDFYEQIGWDAVGDVFVDSLIFVDLRPVSRDYFRRIHQRTRACLNRTGSYLLDGASGPIPHTEQLVYSEGFEYRICLDFSFRALVAAQKRLGSKGIYILGDVINLPLADASVDAVLSMHTLYHVPADRQGTALRELYRVLRPGGRLVLVYNWGDHSLLMKLFSPRNYLNRRLIAAIARLRRFRRTPAADPNPSQPHNYAVNLYFYAHRYSWFGSLVSYRP